MFITLSEKRKEKLLIEWSGEITDEHAQDFCDVCNAVFKDHFDLDYMTRKYEANIYGRSFIVVVYREDKPVGTMGVWRNDFCSRPSFQLVDFATIPAARKGGYPLDILYAIFDELNGKMPSSLIYALPGKMSYPLYRAMGFACRELYAHICLGASQNLLDSMPFIDDAYVEQFMLKMKSARVLKLKGRYYLAKSRRIKGIIPAALMLGEISKKYASTFKKLGRIGLIYYFSAVPGILKRKKLKNAVTYDPAATEQVMDIIPPYYREDGMSLEFNGRNY